MKFLFVRVTFAFTPQFVVHIGRFTDCFHEDLLEFLLACQPLRLAGTEDDFGGQVVDSCGN